MKLAFVVLKHKWFVFRAGLKLGCPLWRLVVHDLSKFSRIEYSAYQRHFYGDGGDPGRFAAAWLHHMNRNDHHWEYWISRDEAGHFPMKMPFPAVQEMVADWMGASRAYSGAWPTIERWGWWDNKWHLILPRLHPETASDVMLLVKKAGVRL